MNFKDSIFNNAFIKDVWTLFSGTAIAQIIGLAFLPLLTRLFLPEEFGIFYIFLTTASILSVVTTGGYEKSFVLPKHDKEASQLLLVSLILSLSVTFLSFIILFFLNEWGNIFFQTGRSQIILWLIPVYAFLFGAFRIFQNWSIRHNKYNWVGSSNIFRSGSLSALQTGFGLYQTGSFGLVIASCISQLPPIWFLIRKNIKVLNNITKKDVKDAYRIGVEYYSFPFYKMPSDLLNEISIQIPLYVLKVVFSDLAVGIYSLPQKLMSQPSRLIGQAVGEVFYRKTSELYSQNIDISEITFATFRTLFLVGVIPFTIVMFWGQEIFSFAFGQEWGSSGRIASYLSPWLLFVFAGSPISYIFLIKQKIRLSFYLNLILLIIRFSALLIGGLIFKDLEITIILFACSSLIYWIYISLFSLHLGGVKIRKSVLFLVMVLVLVVLPIGLVNFFII